MTEAHPPDFSLDTAEERLWRGDVALKLTPTAFALLRYLVEHPRRLLTKDELLDAVWAPRYVNEEVVRHYIQTLRRALGDQAEAPRFIETVRGRGYRFIGAIAVRGAPPRGVPLGRQVEWQQLQSWLAHALAGQHHLGFVTGEPGIGKTTLVNAFLEGLAAHDQYWIASGHCVEFYGTGEAYLPVLGALEQLCRGAAGERILAGLKQHAPTWLLHLSGVAVDRTELSRRTQGATRGRMLQELAQALRVLTAERGMILCFEDLHWVDESTLALLAYLAQPQPLGRLLLLGTYRPVDAYATNQALVRLLLELKVRGRCAELLLSVLGETVVAEYLARRFPGLPSAVASLLHRFTEGNPLFLVNVIDSLCVQGRIVPVGDRWMLQGDPHHLALGTPPTLRQLIEQRLERLDVSEQRLLEAASAAGMAFSVEALAAGLGETPDAVEERCALLARREQFLQAGAEDLWPDGTLTVRYAFLHALYHSVLYGRLPAGKRRRLHQQIGERIERGYGAQTEAVAAELAHHFANSRDSRRAVRYHRQAVQMALTRHAYREASENCQKALALLATLPTTPERDRQELALQMRLGESLVACEGNGVTAAAQAYDRARALAQLMNDETQLGMALQGLWGFYMTRAEYRVVQGIATQLLALARTRRTPIFLALAHIALGSCLHGLGEFVSAREHLEQGLALYNPYHGSPATVLENSALAPALIHGTLTFWVLGHPEQALRQAQQAIALDQERTHPDLQGIAHFITALIHVLRREPEAAQAYAQATMAVASRYELPLWLTDGKILHGWALAEQGQTAQGIAAIREGLVFREGIGSRIGHGFMLGLLAAAYTKVGEIEAAGNTLTAARAVMEQHDECWYDADLHRLQGELLLRRHEMHASEACFQQALAVARRQQAKSWELRAALSLSRLWQQQGQRDDARQLLAEISGWFTEAVDTVDLQEAKALLAELS